jgi:hypothetical protein
MSTRPRAHPWFTPAEQAEWDATPPEVREAIEQAGAAVGRKFAEDMLDGGPIARAFAMLAEPTREERINDDLAAITRHAKELGAGAVYAIPPLLPLKRYGRKRMHWRQLAAERWATRVGYITGWPGRVMRKPQPVGSSLAGQLRCGRSTP